MKKKIYLAGPDVFLPNAIEIGEQKKKLCQKYGFTGLFPFDNEIKPSGQERVDDLIFHANFKMLSDADIGIFNLTPFRGFSADVGTVFELGAMIMAGKKCIGYSNTDVSYVNRVSEMLAVTTTPTGPFAEDGFAVENFDCNSDNLMIDCSLRTKGFGFIRKEIPYGERFTNLEAFEECLRFLND